MFKILFFAFSVFYLLREALSQLPSQQTMDIELSLDVVSACAKRDEPPSRRSRLFHWQSTFCFTMKSLEV